MAVRASDVGLVEVVQGFGPNENVQTAQRQQAGALEPRQGGRGLAGLDEERECEEEGGTMRRALVAKCHEPDLLGTPFILRGAFGIDAGVQPIVSGSKKGKKYEEERIARGGKPQGKDARKEEVEGGRGDKEEQEEEEEEE